MNLQTLLTCILQERSDYNRIDQAYLKTIDAVAGLGTDVSAVLNAIKMLKTSAEFDKYKLKFKDKKTGYNSFQNMINGEYDTYNGDDLLSIIKVLQKINVFTTAHIYVSAGNNRFHPGSFKFENHPGLLKLHRKNVISTAKQNNWLTLLPKAVLWWKNWLSDPITQKKVQSNWDKWYLPGSVTVKIIFLRYFRMLDNLKIKFYDDLDPINWQPGLKDAYAFVRPWKRDNTIYVNRTIMDPDPYGTLIHEIQHIIYDTKPLNPSKKIYDAFVTKNTKRATNKSIESSIKPTSEQYSQLIKDAISRQSSNLKVPAIFLKRWYDRMTLQDDPAYICDTTEKLSNIMSIRRLFKLKPGQNITIAMLIPYIKFEKRQTDITWFLFCWAKRGFHDLNKMLNKINALAVNPIKTKRRSNVA